MSRGAAAVEFAIAWPVAMLAVLASVQLALWGAAQSGAHTAALAGARVGSLAGATASSAEDAALGVLAPVAGRAAACSRGCAGAPMRVAAQVGSTTVTVSVDGTAPALLPGPIGSMPVRASVTLPRESFAP